ncbi:hypothetical protein CSIV_14215 [Microbacterium sp. CSI-V]|uniref:hypothetical protein n=1 Tax=Microbacterium sp. CSI-V TaxID=1933777 RepID=UPI00097C93DF|nr:hypothetical protein [Microbacterium sp. CSI-V]ONI62626.1 hypothetical protein CSIV_14215 [Microbacterium sp. CSI-V]
MSGISQATGILAARDGLWAAIVAATEHRRYKIDRYYAAPETITSSMWVGLTDVNVTPDLKNLKSRQQFDEEIRLGVTLGAYAAGNGDDAARAAFDQAYEILTEIQTYIGRDDQTRTLGGAVMWCLPGSMSNAGVEVDGQAGGYVVEIIAEFVCAHRVRPN